MAKIRDLKFLKYGYADCLVCHRSWIALTGKGKLCRHSEGTPWSRRSCPNIEPSSLSNYKQRDAEQRNGAERAGADDLWAFYHCSTCGRGRNRKGVIVESCPNCGDAEIDLSKRG
jgi:hypothetical protein